MNRKNIMYLAIALLGILAIWYFSSRGKENKVEDSSAFDQTPELARLSALIDQNPNNDTLLYRRARVYYNEEAYDEALKDLNKVVSLNGKNWRALSERGLAHLRLNNLDNAESDLTRSLELVPNNVDALLRRSVVFARANKVSAALHDYEQARTIDGAASNLEWARAQLRACKLLK